MKWLLPKLLNALSRELARLGVCGNSGVIVGALVGGLLTLLQLEHDEPMSAADRVLITAALAVFGWLALMFIFVAFVRYRPAPIALPAMTNAALVTFATSYGLDWLDLSDWAWLLGMVIGAMVGLALCSLSSRLGKGGNRD